MRIWRMAPLSPGTIIPAAAKTPAPRMIPVKSWRASSGKRSRRNSTRLARAKIPRSIPMAMGEEEREVPPPRLPEPADGQHHTVIDAGDVGDGPR